MLCVLLGRSVAAVKPNSSRSLLSSILQSTTDSEKKQVRSRCWLNRNIFCVHKLLYLPLKALKASKKGGQIGTYIPTSKKIWRTSWRRYSFRRWETFIFFLLLLLPYSFWRFRQFLALAGTFIALGINDTCDIVVTHLWNDVERWRCWYR